MPVAGCRRRDIEPDFEAYCACLKRHAVEYLMVGSEAVAVRVAALEAGWRSAYE